MAKSLSVSSPIRIGADIRTRPAGGWTLRWIFRIRLRMTSTVMPPREICIPSVLALLLDDWEEGFNRGLLTQDVVDRPLDLLLACENTAPAVRPFSLDGCVESQGLVQ